MEQIIEAEARRLASICVSKGIEAWSFGNIVQVGMTRIYIRPRYMGIYARVSVVGGDIRVVYGTIANDRVEWEQCPTELI